jgi:hypothetical protein
MKRSVSITLLALYLAKVGYAKSYFFLTSQAPKCVAVEVPSATFVHVSYDVPGRSAMKLTKKYSSAALRMGEF